jgi:glycosyltransferase involved in cell wall biosynthesis
MTAKVSVIIPTYNYGRFINSAIESVLAQTFPIYEIIVVDDGSTDETEEIVKKFGDKVRYIKQKNSGVCAARNNGVANSSGDFIAFLDADDIWLPEKTEKQITKFQENAEIGLVSCGKREFDSESGETTAFLLDGKEGWVADDLLLFEVPTINVSGGAIMVSRQAFDEVGGFDVNLIVAEDWDFCYRIARKFQVGFVPEVMVDYRIHGKNSHLNIIEMERSMKIFYEKAFQTDDKNILRLRQRAFGNFHTKLAGSYFRAKNYRKFWQHSLKSLWLTPQNYGRFLKFPFRWLRRYRLE